MLKHTCSPWIQDQYKDSNRNCPACRAQDGVECTCPDYWFPRDRRQVLRALPHDFGGGLLHHHDDCRKRQMSVFGIGKPEALTQEATRALQEMYDR